MIDRIRSQVAQGRQVYWVCPLIEESEMLDLSNATETHAELSAALNEGGASVAVGLLHSRMPPDEKKAVMAAFVQGSLSVLVSTTVIEVGVDVPNASLMVIENAAAFWPQPVAPAARPGGSGRCGLRVRAAVFHRRCAALGRGRARAPQSHGADQRRL